MSIRIIVLTLCVTLACCNNNSINVSAISSSQGFRIIGDDNDDFAGVVGSAGDLNGDGLADVFIIKTGNDVSGSGVYVVFGTKTQDFSDIEISTMTNSQGFSVSGVGSGAMAAGLGDVNGDGLDDFIVGYENYNSGDGGVNIIFGSKQGFNGVSFGNNEDNTITLTIPGSSASIGGVVAGIGDFNGDGLADIAFTSSVTSSVNVQPIYVIYGSTYEKLSQINIAELSPSQGFTITPSTYIGLLNSAGDINADGLDDLLIANTNGIAYVIYGNNHSSSSTYNLSLFNDSSLGFEVISKSFYINPITGVGDINGDGIDDIACGDGMNIFLIFGTKAQFPLSVNASDLNASQGATIVSYPFTYSVGKLGDINGDNINDFLIGGTTVSVIYGSENGFPSNVDSINSTQGYQISDDGFEETQFGSSVSGAGDINGDGVPDTIIGAPGDAVVEFTPVGIAYVLISPSSNPPGPKSELLVAFKPLLLFINLFVVYFLV